MPRIRFRRSHRSVSRRRMVSIEALEARALLTPIVPSFSSLPGANHTIYLDFDGELVENTNWNSYYNQESLNAPAYSIDGDASTFNATELARIEEAWERTAEDFRPFHINVTTVDPGIEALRNTGGGDTKWGVRAIVTNESSFVTNPAERCNCGGIAYINSFNWNSDIPVWVYTTGGKSIAEAASHEAGHSLGLSHDGLISGTTYYTGHGSGETSWAPIMGVGYNSNVTQWDRGEYYNSNNAGAGANYGSGPDDLAIITTTNGFDYRADDHGDSDNSASVLGVSGTTVSDSGIIETTNDNDVFTFTTGAGIVSLNIAPFTPGPNLDVAAELYNSAGTLVATSNPAATLDASFSLNLAAGQYYLHIDGTGVGSPSASPPSGYSDYASLGQYFITGSVVDPGALPQISIDDVTVDEGAGTASFTVTVSGSVTEPVSVDFATANGSAISGSDYTANGGTLTFTAAGSMAVSVVILDDGLPENTEDFVVMLSNAANAFIADAQGIGTISDDDAAISINDVSANEGNPAKGKKNQNNPNLTDFAFTVSLSGAVDETVTVDFITADGTAESTGPNADYQSLSGTVSFAPGETSKSIVVSVIGDSSTESDETFSVVLSNSSNAIIVDAVGLGTIRDDDTRNGKKSSSRASGAEDAIVVADPFWYFEEPNAYDDHGHDDNCLHGGDPLPTTPFGTRARSLELFRSEDAETVVGFPVSLDVPAPLTDLSNSNRTSGRSSSVTPKSGHRLEASAEPAVIDQVFADLSRELTGVSADFTAEDSRSV